MITRELAPSPPPLDRSVANPSSARHAPDVLRREAAVLSRYILGRDASPELLERYVGAHAHLDVGATDAEHAVLEFAVIHPWSLPCLDAAVALVRPQALLHRKALLMTAILETTPEHADAFLPRAASLPRLAWLGVRVAVSTAAQLLVGLPLLALVGRRG